MSLDRWIGCVGRGSGAGFGVMGQVGYSVEIGGFLLVILWWFFGFGTLGVGYLMVGLEFWVLWFFFFFPVVTGA